MTNEILVLATSTEDKLIAVVGQSAGIVLGFMLSLFFLSGIVFAIILLSVRTIVRFYHRKKPNFIAPEDLL